MGEGAQDPVGLRDWLSKKRGDLQSLGRGFADRETYVFFHEVQNSIRMPHPWSNKEPLFIAGVRERHRRFRLGISSAEICRAVAYLWKLSEF